ncbi:hypothetical protein WMF01_25465 [Sorangium sp. So ce1667]
MATTPASPPAPSAPATPLAFFDYHRTVIGYHGTRRSTAQTLVDGASFAASTNDDDWLGHGIYFWEYAPQQAWWWARRRYGDDAAVVGAMIHLGRCLDLLDPANAGLLRAAHTKLLAALAAAKEEAPGNANTHKYLDCAVFNYMFASLDAHYRYESVRAVFVPLQKGGGMPRLWPRSGVFEGGHIQISIREPRNVLAAWSVRKDGRYGKES